MKRRSCMVPLAVLALAACSDTGTIVDPTLEPAFNHAPAGADVRHVVLCKEGSSADFSVDVDGTVSNLSVADGACVHVASHPGDQSTINVSITETGAPAGFVLDRVDIEVRDAGGVVKSSSTEDGPTVSVQLIDDHVVYVTYVNTSVAVATGRMTGGGAQITVDGARFSRGFTIHCDITLSNNLEINWNDNKWHIAKPLTSAVCIDDPAIAPHPPRAGFDTFIGEAFGRLNGVDGSFVRFVFVDAGEPGRNDHTTITIWAPGADPAVDPPVLAISGFLTHGNIQAHEDQPHR